MKVKVWEVVSGDDCVMCKTKEIANKQIILSPIDEMTPIEIELVDYEIDELNKKGYIWG